jgi:hypothetical protein
MSYKMSRAKKAVKAAEPEKSVKITDLRASRSKICLVGRTPLIFNRQSEKARREFLYPAGPKTAADKAMNLKHDPLEEYRQSPYRNRNEAEPALFHFPSGAFKRAIGTAATDIPGIAKAQINRLCSIESVQVNIYGRPYLRADMVRQAGMARTPDIRFRACLPEWACWLEVGFMAALISLEDLTNLFVAAGRIVGIGDFRVEKGAGDFGQFRVTTPMDPDFLRIIHEQGRAVQVEAMEAPEYFDQEACDLTEWYYDERSRRRNERRVPTTNSVFTPPVSATAQE